MVRRRKRYGRDLGQRCAMTPDIESLYLKPSAKAGMPVSLTAVSLWNVADYMRLRTGGDDPVLEELVRTHTLDGTRVLDLGCGPGHAAAALAERHGAVVTGLDASSEMLAAAREVAPTVTLVQGAAEDMPFEDGSFDIVLSNFVVHLLDRPAAFAEVHRVLRKGGIYWIKTQDPATIRNYWAAPLFPSVIGIETERFPSESRLRDELVAASLRDVHVERRELEQVFSRDEALEKLASGAYSTLRLLPAIELADGIRRAPHVLSDPVRYRLVFLMVEARR
jgi:ubiquinone/menaquinone biosynthesis C-methylase UbiE